MSKPVYKQFKKISVGYEKLDTSISTILPENRKEYIDLLHKRFSYLVNNYNIYHLSKENLARLITIQKEHKPMPSDEFIKALSSHQYQKSYDV